jgi:hypothetical protein
MEYLSPEDGWQCLALVLQDGQPPPDGLAAAVWDSVDAVHGLDVVHGDLRTGGCRGGR